MTPEEIRFFRSAEGRALLEAAAESPGDALARLTRLRKRFPADRCRAAVTLLELRGRARAKFSRAGSMFFDREGLEQASGERIAAHRARRYEGMERIADLCCGIGGDAAALARFGAVLAVDRSPSRVGLARHNAAVYGVADRVRGVVADLETWLPRADAIFMDPSRRESGRRVRALSGYRPQVRLERLFEIAPHVGIKVAPGISYGDLPTGCEAEFVSESGDCKEAVLWFGGLRTGASRRATVLPSGDTLAFRPTPDAPVLPPGRVLYEPDRAVIRAHLIAQLAQDLGAWQLDPEVAYLSADRAVFTPFARAFEITDVFPFSLKRLRRYLGSARVGRVEIKKRRFPLTPEALRPKLRLAGENQVTLFLTRIENRPTVLVCRAEPGR